MANEALVYWIAFTIPLVLLAMTGFVRKVVDASPFRRDHWYLGIDLTLLGLSAELVHVLELARDHRAVDSGQAWTSLLIALTIFILFVQVALHQAWLFERACGRAQFFALCIIANLMGLSVLYGFVAMKLSGLL